MHCDQGLEKPVSLRFMFLQPTEAGKAASYWIAHGSNDNVLPLQMSVVAEGVLTGKGSLMLHSLLQNPLQCFCCMAALWGHGDEYFRTINLGCATSMHIVRFFEFSFHARSVRKLEALAQSQDQTSTCTRECGGPLVIHV